MKFAIPDNFPVVYSDDHTALGPLRERGEVALYSTRHESNDELVERMRGAVAAINVRAYSKFTADELVEFEDVFRQADVVSLHLRASPRTQQIVGKRELELMKPSAYLVNTGRGALVDEGALYEHLKAKKIAGAAIDVYQTEPLPG